MKAVLCGANGAMGQLLCNLLGDEVVGKVSLDGENNVPKTFEELGQVEADVIIAPGETKKIPTGIAMELPVGTAGLIYARSSLGTKKDCSVRSLPSSPARLWNLAIISGISLSAIWLLLSSRLYPSAFIS